MQFIPSPDPLLKLKSHGDLVERHLADRIHAILPSYVRLWAEYIGNDGSAQALPMPEADKDARDSREKYWQRIYTMLESMAICWDIEDELCKIEEISSFKTYVGNLNLWMAFYTHMGRIHDMVKATAGELKIPQLRKPFDEYWHDRNIVLHGPKVPMRKIYNVLAVPSLGESPGHWNDKMVWSQLGTADFEFMAGGVASILRGLEPKLDRYFAEISKILPDRFGWRPVLWPIVSEKRDDSSFSVKLDGSSPDPYDIEIPSSGNGHYSGTHNISGSLNS